MGENQFNVVIYLAQPVSAYTQLIGPIIYLLVPLTNKTVTCVENCGALP